MSRTQIYLSIAVLGALLWPSWLALSVAFQEPSPELLGRSAGILLLLVALIAVLMVFRAVKAPEPNLARRSEPTLRAPNEFRRGFASAQRTGEAVSFERKSIPRRETVAPAPSVAVPVPAAGQDIASVRRRLHDRVAQLWFRPTG